MLLEPVSPADFKCVYSRHRLGPKVDMNKQIPLISDAALIYVRGRFWLYVIFGVFQCH